MRRIVRTKIVGAWSSNMVAAPVLTLNGGQLSIGVNLLLATS
jgi:hypothetical protein